jgi:hypothetical protein
MIIIVVIVVVIIVVIAMIIIVVIAIMVQMARMPRLDRRPTADRRKSHAREAANKYGAIQADHSAPPSRAAAQGTVYSCPWFPDRRIRQTAARDGFMPSRPTRASPDHPGDRHALRCRPWSPKPGASGDVAPCRL